MKQHLITSRRLTIPSPMMPDPLASSTSAGLLRQQLEEATRLCDQPVVPEDAYRKWRTATEEAIARVFGTGSENLAAFRHEDEIIIGPAPWELGEAVQAEQRRGDVAEGIAVLLRCIGQLDAEAARGFPRLRGEGRVFVVHGQDGGMHHCVVGLLEGLGLAVTSHRVQPDRGHTLVEMSSACSEAGFAVVLLTAEDQGVSSRKAKRRVRRNVILELGYFLGHLGRDRVCALHEVGLDLPTDFSDAHFLALDASGRWLDELTRGLRGAGFEVGANDPQA